MVLQAVPTFKKLKKGEVKELVEKMKKKYPHLKLQDLANAFPYLSREKVETAIYDGALPDGRALQKFVKYLLILPRELDSTVTRILQAKKIWATRPWVARVGNLDESSAIQWILEEGGHIAPTEPAPENTTQKTKEKKTTEKRAYRRRSSSEALEILKKLKKDVQHEKMRLAQENYVKELQGLRLELSKGVTQDRLEYIDKAMARIEEALLNAAQPTVPGKEPALKKTSGL